MSSPSVHNVGLDWSHTDTLGQLTDSLYADATASFLYDPNDRLTSVTRSGDNQGIGWDAVGNRNSSHRAGQGLSYTPAPGSNRLASLSGAQWRNFGYDDAGNLTYETRWDGTRGYGYDAFNRLNMVTVNGASAGQYLNNALNQRTFKVNAQGQSRFVYGPSGELLAEFGPNATQYVWLDGELLGVGSHVIMFPFAAGPCSKLGTCCES
ncbi:hypothetical protein ACG02S_24255 [Roseateles sp. DC23W]|uniref:YD repeat-containing protein n=1 Tax=Pelomonas dachongensis TaxID=3299029 RepID=A0ABW7EU23_9BURK